MQVVLQRVARAAVRVEGEIVGEVGRGLLALVGVGHASTAADAVWLAAKTADLRVFPDEEGRMNRSARDVGGAVLAISQFTLYGDASKGRRPSFVAVPRRSSAAACTRRTAARWRSPSHVACSARTWRSTCSPTAP